MKKIIAWLTIALVPAFCYSQSLVEVKRMDDRLNYHKKIPRKIVESHWNPDSREYPYRKYIYTFDPDGVLLSQETFVETGARTTKDTYNREFYSKKVISVIMEWQNRYTSTWTQRWFQYDSSGCVNGTIDKNAKGAIVASCFIRVNKNCDPVEVLHFNTNGELWQKESAEYLYDSNMLVRKLADGDRVVAIDTFPIHSAKGIVHVPVEEQLNDQQDITRVVLKGKNGVLYGNEFEYQYDEVGNWTEKKIYHIREKKNGKWSRSKLRTIQRDIAYKPDKG